MTSYLKSLARRTKKESPGQILGEVIESFEEADPKSPVRRHPKMRRLYNLIRFIQFEEIAPWLEDEPNVVKQALALARKIKDDRLSEILASALDGVPLLPVVMTMTPPGEAPQVIDVSEIAKEMGLDLGLGHDGKDWGGTDIALSFEMGNLEAAVLEELIKAGDEFDLPPPSRLKSEAKAKRQLTKLANEGSAADLFRQLVSTKNSKLELGSWEHVEEKEFDTGVFIAARHDLNPPATQKALASARRKFGASAKDLLEIYAVHDGGDLFQHRRKCGFVLVSMEYWAERHAHAVEWVEIAWPKEDIPFYVYSSIAFGLIPGDCYSWLLITEGKFAGSVMYSDTDSIEEPSFKNIREFLATMLHDTGRIMNRSAHVQYHVKGEWLHPLRLVQGKQT